MSKHSDKYREYSRSLLVGALAGVALALVFCAGFFIRDFVDLDAPSVFASERSGVAGDQTGGYPLLDEVDTLIRVHYLRELPDDTQRQYAAIRGMLSVLGDRNTFFIDPPVAQSESDVLAGTYGGIGVTIRRDESGVFLLYPFVDSPALEAGIQDGDILLAIDGEVINLETSQDAVDQMLRGEVKEDSGVELTVQRGDDEITQFILFDVINVPSVIWRVTDDDARIGYLQVLRFTSRTPDEVREAIGSLMETEATTLILDLRNNSGGLLQESIDVASIFLDGGVILYEVTNSGEQTYSATNGGLATDVPIVVLINNRTASASELVAGAIQDRDRGILIGQTTFGKGTIQQIFPLSDASSVHITSAEWLTPDRNAIEGVGLQPDVAMIPDENGRDVEFGEAIRYLQDTYLQDEQNE